MSLAALMFRRGLIATWILVALCSAMQLSAQAPTTVHVFTAVDPSGLVDATGKDRQRAVDEIRKRLLSRHDIRVVTERSIATILIEVTSVKREPVWMPTPLAEAKPLEPGQPLPEGTRPALVARAVLTSGTFKTSFAEAAGAFRANVGGNLARSVEQWFKDNSRALTSLQ